MFVLTRNVSASQKAIATLLATAVVLWTLGYHMTAQAANVTSFSDVITDSAPGASADHLITFTVPTAMAIGETFTITFPGDFGMGSIVIGDVDLDIAGDQTLAATAAAGTWGVSGFGGNTLTFETPTDAGTAGGETFIVDIGTAATGGTNQIVNPTSPTGGNQSYEISIAGTMADVGYTRVVILDTVLVTASILTEFDFTVTGKLTGTTVNGIASTLDSSSTTIPFGTLAINDDEIIAQELNVTTNASNGFVVTVQTDGEFRSSTGAEIDGFVDNTDTITPTLWAAPSENITLDTTWGHWGFATDDTDVGDGIYEADEFGADEWIAATTSARAVFAHTGPSDGTTEDIGSTTVAYKVQISPLQEAGDDYQTTLTYIATPTF